MNGTKNRKTEVDFLKDALTVAEDIIQKSRHLTAIVACSDDAIISKTIDGIVLSWNPAAEKLFGYNAEEMIGRPMTTIFPTDRLEEETLILSKIALGERVDHFETVRVHKEGHLVHVSVTISPIYDEFGHVIGASKIARDISKRIKAEKLFRQQSAGAYHLAAIVESSDFAIISKGLDGVVISWNKGAESIFGYRADEMIGRPLLTIFPADKFKEEEHILRKISRGERVDHFRTVRVHKNGQIVHVSCAIAPIVDADGNIIGVSNIAHDISNIINSEKEIWQQANFDALTQLPNRRLFADRLNQTIYRCMRDTSQFVIIYIDLDGFKDINDSLGHNYGDELLKGVAERVRKLIRTSDTLARLGGDEFVLLLPDLNLRSAEFVSNNLIEAMRTPFKIENELIFTSMSMGVAQFPNDGIKSDDLLKHADQAMYEAKRAGKNQARNFSQSMQISADRHMQLSLDLRSAIKKQQLELYYQPIKDVISGKICKAEALLRWHHPYLGMLSPAEFIPIAEETGLIVEIGDWVFDQAVSQLKKWQQTFDKDFQISINKSPVQCRINLSNPKKWADTLASLEIKPSSLIVEITENVMMTQSDDVMNKLLLYRDFGIQVAIDDFGTGYSSLSYLNRFDIDFLKIDKSFVNDLLPNSNEYHLCEAITIMAHKLGLKVIAEGVENEHQELLLAQLGCDYIQGYLLSKPLPESEFDHLIQNYFGP